MAAMSQSHTLSVSIKLKYLAAYDFLAKPENFPKWASGLCQSIQQQNGVWVAETADGPMTIRFTAPNGFGVLDHYVSPQPGVEIYVPMRILANGDGSELVFTLFRQPGMSDEKFAEDIEWVGRDLKAVKALLEA